MCFLFYRRLGHHKQKFCIILKQKQMKKLIVKELDKIASVKKFDYSIEVKDVMMNLLIGIMTNKITIETNTIYTLDLIDGILIKLDLDGKMSKPVCFWDENIDLTKTINILESMPDFVLAEIPGYKETHYLDYLKLANLLEGIYSEYGELPKSYFNKNAFDLMTEITARINPDIKFFKENLKLMKLSFKNLYTSLRAWEAAGHGIERYGDLNEINVGYFVN
jgi:hypothetical protein